MSSTPNRLQRLLTGGVLCMLALALLAGCKPNDNPTFENHELILAPENTVSIYELAGRLGLRVVISSATYATLGREHVTVVVFPERLAAFFIGSPGRQSPWNPSLPTSSVSNKWRNLLQGGGSAPRRTI